MTKFLWLGENSRSIRWRRSWFPQNFICRNIMKKWNLAQCCLALTGDSEMKNNAVFDHEKLVIGKMKTFIVSVIAICGLEIEFLAFKSQCRSMTQVDRCATSTMRSISQSLRSGTSQRVKELNEKRTSIIFFCGWHENDKLIGLMFGRACKFAFYVEVQFDWR